MCICHVSALIYIIIPLPFYVYIYICACTCIYIYIYISSIHLWYILGLRYARPKIYHKCEGLLATFLAVTYNNPF